MRIAVLLSGCGVYDGSEIHESVLSLLAIDKEGHHAQCFSINENQYHVINHLNGEECDEKRNMLVESARITRGNVKDISLLNTEDYDVLFIPGGFGSAKNFSNWAFKGPDSDVHQKIKDTILSFYRVKKIIVCLCVSPVLIAKTFENFNINAKLTLGSKKENSPYDILSFHQGLELLGSKTFDKKVDEIMIDKENRIITSPCYMMEASIVDIYNSITLVVKSLNEF